MKSILFFATTALAASATVQKRQASVISDAISTVSASVAALNDAISSFSSPGDAAAVQAASDAVVSAVNAGNSAVSPIAVLSQNDALPLAGPITTLADTIDSVVDNIISRKDAFVGANVGNLVYQAIQQQQAGADSFSATILSKIPDSLQSIGQDLAARIRASLQRANEAYADQANAGGSTSTTGGSTAPTSTTGGTTAPTSSAATTSGGAYTTAPPATTSGGAYTTTKAPGTTSGVISSYPGAAPTAGVQAYGAAAVAALAVAALL